MGNERGDIFGVVTKKQTKPKYKARCSSFFKGFGLHPFSQDPTILWTKQSFWQSSGVLFSLEYYSSIILKTFPLLYWSYSAGGGTLVRGFCSICFIFHFKVGNPWQLGAPYWDGRNNWQIIGLHASLWRSIFVKVTAGDQRTIFLELSVVGVAGRRRASCTTQSSM